MMILTPEVIFTLESKIWLNYDYDRNGESTEKCRQHNKRLSIAMSIIECLSSLPKYGLL